MMRHLFRFLFASGLAIGAVPATANYADARAALELGDYQTAYAEFLRLAQAGDANAQTALGLLYDEGRGVPKDPSAAVAWYQKAAETGNPQAQLNLGLHYERAEGVGQDYGFAIRWYRKAAEQGYAPAEVALGTMYYRGLGLPEDKSKANVWFKRAAEQGNASAQQNLANALYFGQGAEIDYAEAFKLYQKAAAQGYADSQFNLGVMYDKGQGVPKDLGKAYFWWLLASERGAPDAARNRDRIEKLLTAAQREEAQTAAKQWKPTVQAPRSELETSPNLAVSPVQKSEPEAVGTALRISANYYLADFHSVQACRRLRINGSQNAERQAVDEANDFVLLSVPPSSGPTALIRVGRIHVDELVTAVAFPLPGDASPTLKLTSGKVSSLSGLQGDTRFIQISASAQLVNGAAVFDASGNVLGVVQARPNASAAAQATGDNPQNVSFAITSNALQGFLDANSVDFESAGLGVALTSAQVASFKNVVALVECWR